MMETDEARRILHVFLRQFPPTGFGVEREMAIGDFISRLPVERRAALTRMIDSFLARMLALEASDIDIGGHGSFNQIWYRVYGVKKPDPTVGTFAAEEISALIQNILTENQRIFLYEKKNLDFSYSIRGEGTVHRFRANAYFDLDHLALNMRAIDAFVRPYKDLELHPNVTRVMNLSHTKEGLILVTGITGSGKNSTLDTIVDANNHAIDAHVVIIGSPIEYVHKSDRCIIRHREVGKDVLSFWDGVVQCLRQDPDIIVIGEMRDPETIMTALEITDTGHKVFSTLHTASAVESIDRIIAEVPSLEQNRVRNRLADVLKCVISQKLVPSLDGKRVLAKEVLLVTPSVKAAIRNGNTQEIYQMISESGRQGMITMEQDLMRLYLAKKISLDTAMDFANNKRRLEQLLATKSD
jgi:twitching motility protein PilT